MTIEEILKLAIEKAMKNGWKLFDDLITGVYDKNMKRMEHCARIGVIFSHDFAKAFWGEACPDHKGVEKECNKSYQYHLQQMVLSEDPIKYLSKFL